MNLPGSYTLKPSSIPAYFDAVLAAQPPERFTNKFLENLGFTSSNDRLFIGILKDLGFLSADGVPEQRYFQFMDQSISKRVLAVGIRDSFGDLFAVNTKANELSVEDVRNKLRTIYAGKKTNNVIDRIAGTFVALCDYADFTEPLLIQEIAGNDENDEEETLKREPGIQHVTEAISLDSLQYHINIVLPDTRDQAVYDSIFRSLREHLGSRHG